MSPPPERRPQRPRSGHEVPGRLSVVPRDVWLALGAGAVVALGAGLGLLLGGSDGALTGTIIGFAVCVFFFTVSTLVWATGAARHYRSSTRRPR